MNSYKSVPCLDPIQKRFTIRYGQVARSARKDNPVVRLQCLGRHLRFQFIIGAGEINRKGLALITEGL